MAKLSSIAKKNDRRKTLEALRDVLAEQIEGCSSGRDIAALSLRLMNVEDELSRIPNEDEAPSAVEMARRRASKGKDDG